MWKACKRSYQIRNVEKLQTHTLSALKLSTNSQSASTTLQPTSKSKFSIYQKMKGKILCEMWVNLIIKIILVAYMDDMNDDDAI